MHRLIAFFFSDLRKATKERFKRNCLDTTSTIGELDLKIQTSRRRRLVAGDLLARIRHHKGEFGHSRQLDLDQNL